MSELDDRLAEGGRRGQLIGDKYLLVRFMGSGGMGEVYEARHAAIGRRFAVKVLHRHLVQRRSGEFAARFQREANSAGQLEHENLVAAVDFGTTLDGTYFIAMEYLDGESLARLLARTGPLSVPRAVNILIQACRGVSAAHQAGIVHRDLKPENLYLCRRADGKDFVKVLDFGIAKVNSEVLLTQSGIMLGTPCYMSTEQARGAKHVDERTDIYSLGVVLYEALAGTHAHPGDSYNEVLYHILTKEPAPLETLRVGLPDGLSAIVHRAMAREPQERFPSVAALAEVLGPFASLTSSPYQAVERSPVETTVRSSTDGLSTIPVSQERSSQPDLNPLEIPLALAWLSRRTMVPVVGLGLLLLSAIGWKFVPSALTRYSTATSAASANSLIGSEIPSPASGGSQRSMAPDLEPSRPVPASTKAMPIDKGPVGGPEVMPTSSAFAAQLPSFDASPIAPSPAQTSLRPELVKPRASPERTSPKSLARPYDRENPYHD